MIRCECIGCSAVIEADDDAAGTAVLCARCGYLIQVPEGAAPAPPAPDRAPARSKAAAPAGRRGKYLLGAMHGLFVVCLPVSLTHVQDGSPLCLAMFGLNLFLSTVAGFLFLVCMHTPDYLTDWLEIPFTRARGLLLLPLTVLGFLLAIHIYSP